MLFDHGIDMYYHDYNLCTPICYALEHVAWSDDEQSDADLDIIKLFIENKS